MYAGNERRNRVVALVLALVLLGSVVLALLATVLQSGPAQAATLTGLPAHASLVSISPAEGATLEREPNRIELTFDDVIAPGLAKIVLTRDGEPVPLSAPTVTGNVVIAELSNPGGPGAYRIAWQVTSDDGHPVAGESTFAVAVGAVPRPKVTPTYKTPQTQATTFGHPDHLPGLIVAGVLLLCGVALLIYEHRRRRAREAAEDQHIS